MEKPTMWCKLFFCLLFCVMRYGHSQETFSQKFQQASPTSIVKFHVDFSDGDANFTQLPVAIIKGKEEGKTLTVLAGIHGYEYPPIIAVQTFMKEIEPKKLKGNIIVIPISNTASFYGRSPFVNPLDDINLNNAFPGNENGSVTEQISNYITQNIIPVTDVFLDIHGGDASEDLIPFVCYYDNSGNPKATNLAKQLSEASGFANVVSYPYTLKEKEPAKYAFKQAVQDGKVGLSFEAGALGNVQKSAVEFNLKGIYNVLASLEMYTSQFKKPEKLLKYKNQTYVKVPKSGIFYSEIKAGDKVGKGQEIGIITNEFGELLTTITAPETGTILYKIGTPPVNQGETLMCIGIPTQQ